MEATKHTISIIIPIWNGADTITDCLQAVYAHLPTGQAVEVIGVDNGSTDDSATLVAQNYPQVKLLRQSINLGFAGGVNVGLHAATGEMLILLNQDCLVQADWLTAIHQTMAQYPQFGILGCTIFNPDHSINHTGAFIHYPDAYSVHLTEISSTQPYQVEYVTGAALALRRQTWEQVGDFDEGFYPAYYEESDYCYRARHQGIAIGVVPAAQVIHLFSGRGWQTDPTKHAANQHRSRYRFVSKHFNEEQLKQFFESESQAIEVEKFFEQLVGRMLAARDTLRNPYQDSTNRITQRQLQVGFTNVLRTSFLCAEKLNLVGLTPPPIEDWQKHSHEIKESFNKVLGNLTYLSQNFISAQATFPPSFDFGKLTLDFQPSPWAILSSPMTKIYDELHKIQQQEYDLVDRICCKSKSDKPESTWQRLFRLLIKRPLSFLIGREYLLSSQLNVTHVARLDSLEKSIHLQFEQIQHIHHQAEHIHNQLQNVYQHLLYTHERSSEQFQQAYQQINLTRQQLSEIAEPLKITQHDIEARIIWLHQYQTELTQRRLKLLELLTNYDYR